MYENCLKLVLGPPPPPPQHVPSGQLPHGNKYPLDIYPLDTYLRSDAPRT